MVLNGFDDMTFVGGTMKTTRKVAQLKKNPEASVSIWSGKEFSDPYVIMKGKGEIREDLETKKKYWNPMFEKYFQTVDNPNFVIVKFVASEIEYVAEGMTGMEIWKR